MYIYVCVAKSFRQLYSATTLQLVVESPPGRHCGWLATPVCVWERERGRESITSTSHTRPAALLTHQWLWPCPDARYSLSHLFLLSLFPYLLLLHRPVSWYFHTSSVVSHGCYPNLTVSLLWRTGKGFSPCTGSAAVATGSTGADTHNIIDKKTIANVFFFLCQWVWVQDCKSMK